MKKMKLSALLAVILALTIFNACGGKTDKKTTELDNKNDNKPAAIDTASAVNGDWVVIRELSDPEKMNPIVSNDASASEIGSYIFETLMNQDKETYELIPGLASGMPEISPDNLIYIFKLNPNAKFSDGKPLTGEDVIFTLKVTKNPFVDAAALRNYYEMIEKAELVNGDPYTLKFTLTKPNWRGLWTLAAVQVVAKHVLDPGNVTDKMSWEELKDFKTAERNPEIKKFADFMNSQEVSREAKYLIGSGPYMFDKWDTGAGVTIRRSPNYWGKQVAPNYPNKIIFKTIQDNSAALVAAKNKEVDAMYVVKPSDFYKDLENADQFSLQKARPFEPAYTYLAWNQLNPLFQDKRVRLALSHLIDRKTIIDKVMFGDGLPIQSHIFYKNTKLLNPDLPIIEYDVEKAKKLLEEAGWKDTDGDGVLDKVIDGKKKDFKFTFLSNTNPTRKQILLVIVDALKKVGIQAEVQELEWSVYLDKTKKHEFEATYSAWTSPTTPPDPYQIWHSTQSEGEGSNYISFKNKENDSLIEAYRNEMDEGKRIELIKRWQKLIYDEQPYTFLWSPRARYIYDKRFKNARWYNYQPSPSYNEWWAPSGSQKYTQDKNY